MLKIPEINQSNLYLLVEYKGLSIVEAIKKVYASNLYKKLKIESTNTWHSGPVALYQELEFDHSHTNIDATIGNTRVISNQMDYVYYGEHLHDFKGDKFIEL